MSHLSDIDIKRRLCASDESQRIAIDPLGDKAIQPASLDVRLGATLLEFDSPPNGIIDPADPDTIRTRAIKFDASAPVYHIRPGETVLGVTYETITLPSDILAKLEGKSSLARVGLGVHVTAGIVDPGWSGKLTFEFVNLARYPIKLQYKMYCAQLIFDVLVTPAERPYGHEDLNSKYQGDVEPVGSKYYLNASN